MDGLRLIETPDELDDLRPAWEELAAPAGSPMQRHAWAKAFSEAFGNEHELKVVVACAGGQVSAIAPLSSRRAGVTRLELAGVEQLSEPGDFVYRDRAALDPLAAGVAELGLPVLLGRVVADSPIVEALRAAYRRRTVYYARGAAPYPWIELDEGWTEPEAMFGSDRRSDLRRARRRAEQLGDVTTEVVSPLPEEVAPLIDELFRVEAAGWKGREGTALARDAPRRRFFERFAELAAEAGFLRIAFLRIDGRAAAVQLAAECGNRFWLLKVGYDEELGRSSPGSLLMLETIRYAAARGLASYELLGVAEPWTRVWTERERECLAIRAYPPRRVGLAAAAADIGRIARRARRAARA